MDPTFNKLNFEKKILLFFPAAIRFNCNWFLSFPLNHWHYKIWLTIQSESHETNWCVSFGMNRAKFYLLALNKNPTKRKKERKNKQNQKQQQKHQIIWLMQMCAKHNAKNVRINDIME